MEPQEYQEEFNKLIKEGRLHMKKAWQRSWGKEDRELGYIIPWNEVVHIAVHFYELGKKGE